MKEIFEKIGPLPRHINSPSYDLALSALAEKYRLEIHKYDSTHNHNGWVIPPKYHVESAHIKFNGELIYDGCSHPLGVISYSKSFSGKVTKEELLKHCYYDHRNEEWIPYHFRQSYRPWDRDWGFCLPKKIIENLRDGIYDVEINVIDGVEELKIGRGYLKGKSDLNIALCAHLDHPGLVNDDLSGVVVILEALEKLRDANLNYGIEVFVVPEIIGTQYYLNNNKVPFEGLFVESVGQGGDFCLQQSLNGVSIMDSIASNLVVNNYSGQVASFRSVYGNDEINFESFGCPMPSLTRGVFAGYHSSEDNVSNISYDCVSEAISLVVDIVKGYQSHCIIEKKFIGVIALANPMHNLYVDPGQIAFGMPGESAELRKIMDALPTYGKYISMSKMLKHLNIACTEKVINYLKLWEDRGLIKLHGLYDVEVARQN